MWMGSGSIHENSVAGPGNKDQADGDELVLPGTS